MKATPYPIVVPLHTFSRRERDTNRALRALRRARQSTLELWDGGSWQPGRDWLTRVESWDNPQTPR